MEMKKILVPVDFSEGSEVAVHHALNIARHLDTELVLLHVGVILEHPADLPGAGSIYAGVARAQLEADRAQLGELRARISGQGVQVSQMVADGFADTAIVDAAAELDADLIVMGSHGRSGIRRLLLGSVAERVVRLAPCSVLVARRDGELPGGYRRLLVPTDFSPTAEQALATALSLAAPGATVDVLHCWSLPPGGPDPGTADWQGIYRAAGERIGMVAGVELDRLIDRPAPAGVTLHRHLLEDTPAHGIQQWLEGHPYDLVVTGSHGRRGVRRFLLGSVAEATVRHAPCSVLVAHGRG